MSDLISRQAAIDALTELRKKTVASDSFRLGIYYSIEEIKNVPSAHPETHDKRTETHACDLINRQQAIELIDYFLSKPCKGHTGDFVEGMRDGYYRIRSCINCLPSAQPETAKRIVGKSRKGMTLWYQCSMCNEPVDVQDDFCSGCGRKLTDG